MIYRNTICWRHSFPMETANSIPHSHATAEARASSELGDFSTDHRVLLLCLLATPIGVIGAFVAKALLWLIAVITNAAYFMRWSSAPVTPEFNHLGLWAIAV